MWYLLDLGLNQEKVIMATCTSGDMMGIDGCMILLQIFCRMGMAACDMILNTDFFFADFAFVSVSFLAFLSDKLLTIKEGALQRKFFSVDAGFVTPPLKLPHASILQAAKVLKLLVCCRPSLSLLLLTPNKVEFEKSEVRNGNICPNVKSDTTI